MSQTCIQDTTRVIPLCTPRTILFSGSVLASRVGSATLINWYNFQIHWSFAVRRSTFTWVDSALDLLRHYLCATSGLMIAHFTRKVPWVPEDITNPFLSHSCLKCTTENAIHLAGTTFFIAKSWAERTNTTYCIWNKLLKSTRKFSWLCSDYSLLNVHIAHMYVYVIKNEPGMQVESQDALASV